MSKTLYHSELAGMGDVDAFIVRDVGPSKFDAKPGCTSMMIGPKTAVITMKINGEDRIYTIENDRCGAALRGLQGQTVTIRAEGSREDATISVFGAPQSHRQPDPQPPHREPNRSLPQRPLPNQNQQPAHNPPPREPDPAPAQHRRTKEEKSHDELEAFKEMLRFVRRGGLVLQECINVASEISADKLSTEDRRQLAITLFIEVKGRIDLKQLPIQRPVATPSQPTRQPAPPPPRQPERQQRPPDADKIPMDDLDDVPF